MASPIAQQFETTTHVKLRKHILIEVYARHVAAQKRVGRNVKRT